MKSFLFRCDFGGAFGWGHLVRCAALARVARECGYITGVMTSGDPSVLPSDIASVFDETIRLDGSCPSLSFWEGLFTQAFSWDVVLIDHYGYVSPRLNPLLDYLHTRSVCCVQVEDHPKHFSSHADVILCPGFSGEGIDLDVFGSDKVYAGLDYVLLRPEFGISAEDTFAPRGGGIPRIAVILGGTDPSLLMPRVLQALYEATKGLCIPEIILPAGADEGSLLEVLSRFSKFRVHEQMSSKAVAQCFKRCDYGITACGGTVYEMASLGLPFIGVCVAENQEKTARYMEKAWSLPIIQAASFSQAGFASAWAALVAQFPEGRRPYASIDARGPYRALSAIVRSIQAQRSRGQAPAAPQA